MEAVQAGTDFSYFPYSMLHKVKAREVKDFGFWVADECHYLKSPTANRTHAFYSLLKETLPQYFIGLTGTPIKNRAYDFWTLLAFCGLNPRGTSGKKLTGDLAKYRAFCRHFCESSLMKVNGARFEKFGAIKPEKIPEFKSLLKGKYIRFKVQDVLKDLPEFTRKDVVIEGLRPDVELAEVFREYMAGRKVDVTAKARSALLKAKSTAAYVAEMHENGVDKAVIFSDHVDPVRAITLSLNDAAEITGATPMAERQEAVAKFQRGELRYIVATIGAMSVGVTLTAANHVVFNDLSWVPADNLQAEKRIHRIGQKSACFAHYIHATPTDLHIQKTLQEKLCTIGALIG
jgi:SWI/SNF-related matrix-associated actin-dependent regulator 1 of chromatin subfamily A